MYVYAPVFDTPSAIKAGKTIADAIYDLQLTTADAPCVIAGDFNHCDLRKIIPSLKQYVSFPTRKNCIIVFYYGNIPHTYKLHSSTDQQILTLCCQVGSTLQAKNKHSLHHKKNNENSGHLKILTN